MDTGLEHTKNDNKITQEDQEEIQRSLNGHIRWWGANMESREQLVTGGKMPEQPADPVAEGVPNDFTGEGPQVMVHHLPH